MSAQIIREDPPGETRVMFEPYPKVAKKVLAAPNTWFRVATGGVDRRRVYSQTAYLIRNGKITAFAKREDGTFEVRVVTVSAEDDEHDESDESSDQSDDTTTRMYLRWVPSPKG